MTPRTLPSARFAIEERDPSGWFPSPPRACSPRLPPYETLAWSRALGASSTRAPLPSVFRLDRKEGAVHWSGLPMRHAHESGTRRCSYRICHRDRSASTWPIPTNLAGPARSPLAGQPANHALCTGLPRSSSAVPDASGFEPSSFEPVPSPAVSPQGPVPSCPAREGGPGGLVADTQHLFVIPQGPRSNAETFEPDNTMTLRDQRTLGARADPRRRARTSDPRCHPPSGRAA
jgi:hypothetical protein